MQTLLQKKSIDILIKHILTDLSGCDNIFQIANGAFVNYFYSELEDIAKVYFDKSFKLISNNKIENDFQNILKKFITHFDKIEKWEKEEIELIKHLSSTIGHAFGSLSKNNSFISFKFLRNSFLQSFIKTFFQWYTKIQSLLIYCIPIGFRSQLFLCAIFIFPSIILK